MSEAVRFLQVQFKGESLPVIYRASARAMGFEAGSPAS